MNKVEIMDPKAAEMAADGAQERECDERTRRCPNIQCEGVVLPGEVSCRDCGFGHYDSPI